MLQPEEQAFSLTHLEAKCRILQRPQRLAFTIFTLFLTPGCQYLPKRRLYTHLAPLLVVATQGTTLDHLALVALHFQIHSIIAKFLVSVTPGLSAEGTDRNAYLSLFP